MQEIMKIVAERKERLAAHPFYEWVRTSAVALEERLTFAPIMANFVMNFRDMNKWFIRFAQASDQFKEVINGNTDEDETHSALFVEDWRTLHLDERLSWRASDTLWWLFLAADTEPFRAYGIEFARLTVDDGGDPLLRFTHSEAGEACGNAFFTVVAPVATDFEKRTGLPLRYFGEYHLNRERGHVIASEGVFEVEQLSPERRRTGLMLATEMFDIFFGMHDSFLAYAKGYVAQGVTPQRPKTPPVAAVRSPSAPPARRPQPVTSLHIEVQRVLDERRAKTAAHPFYAWMLRDTSLSAGDKLRRFLPMWVMDIMGYRDLNRYALRFWAPTTEAQVAFNRWATTLETHSGLFLNDWDALGMDEALGWRASDTLEFIFLDRDTDVHRRNIASFIKLALTHKKTSLRFWLLEALEASGESFFATVRKLALIHEATAGVRLDYLADRHYLAHTEEDGGSWSYPFKSEALAPEERDVAITMVHTVFDAVDEQLLLSLRAIQTNKFSLEDEPKPVLGHARTARPRSESPQEASLP